MTGVYSVGQITSYIKNMFEQDFALSRVSIKGEVSNCKYHTSGHLYFTLKDSAASIRCILFASNRENLTFRLMDGMQVTVQGNIRIYERDGGYQLYAVRIQEDGVGELYRRYEQLKTELEEMGMFSAEYKKPIPAFSMKIGVVTAATGAAIRDIMQITQRRNPHVSLTLYPALVQGVNAAPDIVRGIEMLDKMGLDCLIVGRGGGSIEDLWAFNEEMVARAIFDCDTPVISAVGHQTDYTIADFVADLRAPTPSAAAELAVFDAASFFESLEADGAYLCRLMEQSVEDRKKEVQALLRELNHLHPGTRLEQEKKELEEYRKRLSRDIRVSLESCRTALSAAAGKLDAYSPLRRLQHGCAYVTVNQHPVLSAAELKEHDLLSIRFHDGAVQAVVTHSEKEEA